MSVYLWRDFEGNSDGYRKVYRDGKKATPRFPYKNTVYAVENEPTPENIVSLLEQIWAEDWPVAISQFGPKPFEEIRDACCEKGRALCDPEEGWFRRHGKALDETLMDFVVLDFDCEESTVSWDSTLNSRLDAAKSLLPLLEGLETVAFLSSSAYYRDPAKAHRMSLHVLVWLDKPYTRREVASFLKRCEIVDKTMAVLTQPHIVANPRFLNTPRLEIEGPRILHTPGKRLCLDEIAPPAIHTTEKANAPKNSDGEVFTDLKELSEDLLKRAKAGELDGRRTEILYRAIFRANWFHDGDTQEFLKDIDVPEITTGAGGRHDIYKMDSDAKANIKRELTGEERNATRAKDTKILRHLDLADYDIEDLPTKNCVITLKSGCGSGKTKGFIKKFIEKTGYTRALYVSVYKGTIEPTAREIDFSYYLAMGESAKHEWMNGENKLASTDKSLKALFNYEKNTHKHYELLIIDECERVALNSLDIHSNQQELFNLAITADAVLMCDADISDELTNWFAKEIANKSTERKELIKLINTADWMGADGGHEVYRLEEEKDVVEITNRLLQKDQRVYMHVGYSDKTERQRISALVSYFEKNFPSKKIYGYDANTAPKELRNSPNKYIDELIEGEGLDLLILSPWSHIGWDYNSKAHLFDATVGSYPHSFMTAPDIAQAMRRPRQTKLHYVWMGKRGAYQKKVEYEETWENHPYIRSIPRGVPQELANKARVKKAVQESNVSYHFKLLMEERGANFHRADTFHIDAKALRELLTKYGKEAHEDRISRIYYREPWERDQILRNFYVWDGETRHLLTEPIDPSSECRLSEEEFSELFLRDERLQGKDIGRIADIWFRSPGLRKLKDKVNSEYFAFITGELLDHIDKIVRLRIGNPDSFLLWLLDDDSEELHVSFNEQDVKDFMSWAENFKNRLEDQAPWLRYAGLNTNRASFISSVANWFDCHASKVSQIERIKKAEAGDNVIRYYMELGLIPFSRAKKIPQKKEKLQEVDAILDEKLRNHEPLGHHETEWLSFRFRYNLKITKNTYRSAFVRQELLNARSSVAADAFVYG